MAHKSTPAPFYSEALTGLRLAPPTRPDSDPAPVEQRYAFERVLGEGTMGVVHLARDRETGGRVAVKKLFRMDGKTVMRLKREFRSLADISHPNLVKVYELGHADDGWFLAMEHVQGQGLLAYLGLSNDDSATMTLDAPSLDSMDGLDRRRIVSAFFQLAQGVHALHRAGMLHRDLKPSNVLVTGDRVVVLDFGLVRELSPEAASLTEEGGIAGTPAYMAPEQILGKELSEKSDWYAFGVMLYQVLAGAMPFEGSVYDLVRAKQERDPVSPRTLNPDVPADLNELCMALLSRDPAGRPGGLDVIRKLDSGQMMSSDLLTEGLTLQTDARLDAARAPLFGREPECHALSDALQRAQAGNPAVVHVRGVSGAGKSALVEYFLDEVEHGVSVGQRSVPLILRSRCYEREAMPFKALDSVVDALARHLVRLPDLEVSHLLPTGLDALSRLFPVLQRLRAVQHLLSIRPADGDAVNSRQRAEVALRELFGRLSAQRTVVIWIDDLQWGDLDSARILKGWMQEATGLPVLLILSYRSDEAATSDCLRMILDADPDGLRAETLHLAPLGHDDMVRLCQERLGELAQDHPDVVERIVAEADGSPFLAAQLATLVQARARRGGVDVNDVSLRDLLAQVTTILPQGTRQLLDALAIAGRPTLVKHALRAAGVRSGGRDHVQTLRRLQLVRSRTVGGERYLEVYHDRIREGVVRNLDGDKARRIHGNLLKALEYSGRAEPDILHGLALSAGEPVAALRYGLAAAERATATLAFERAAALYQTCLDLTEEAAPSRKMLLRKLGDALAWCGRGAHAAEAYLQASDLAEGAEVTQLMRFAASHFLRSGRFEEGDALVERLLRLTDLELPSSPASLIGSLLWERTRLAARGLSFSLRSEADVPAKELARIDLVAGLRMELMLVDPLRSALLLMRQLRWALDAGEPRRVLEALCGLCSLAATGAGGQARVEGLLARIDALVAQMDTPAARALACATRALANWMLGHSEEAIAPAEEAERLYSLPEANQLYGGYYVRLAAISVRIGSLYDLSEFEASRVALTGALREVQATDNRAARLYLALNEAGYSIAAGLTREARVRLDLQREQLPKRGFGIYHALHMSAVSWVAAASGEYGWGLSRLEEDWPRFMKSLVKRASMVDYLAHLNRVLLIMNAQLSKGRPDAATTASLRREIKALETLRLSERGKPLAGIFHARLAHALGDQEKALACLREAVACSTTSTDTLRSRYALGFVQGDEGGNKLMADTLALLRDSGLQRPEDYLRVYYPEFFVGA